MTKDFALNMSMISKEEYLDKKAYYDHQRKLEWNREKCMKICEDLKVLDDEEVISFNCVDNVCIDPSDGSGQFSNINDCLQNCSLTNESWRCDNGVCGVLNDGTGKYSSLEECEKQCQDISSIMEDEFNLNIFPNPSYDSFTLKFISNGIIDVNVTNLIGEKILIYKLNTSGNHTMILDLSSYPKGIYNLFINTNNRTSSEKLILQ